MGLSNYLPNSRISQSGVCTSSTRPASPYEGQIIYETDTNRVLVWDNAAWVMIADTDQPPGLQLVKTQTIGTSVSSVTVDDAFSSDFDNYKIILSGGSHSQTTDLRIQLKTSSTTTTTGYYYNLIYMSYTGNTINGLGATNTTHWAYVGSATTNTLQMGMDIFAPYLAKRTLYTSSQSFATTTTGYYTSGGNVENNTKYTGFVISGAAGTMTGGTICVYGYRIS